MYNGSRSYMNMTVNTLWENMNPIASSAWNQFGKYSGGSITNR